MSEAAGTPPLEDLVFAYLEAVETRGRPAGPALAELCQRHPDRAADLCRALELLAHSGLGASQEPGPADEARVRALLDRLS